MSLIIEPVTHYGQVEMMGKILNECLEFMTKPMAPITPERQKEWWDELPSKVAKFKAFTYKTDRDLVTIAFSLLQWHHDGRITPLFGISKIARGQNIARQIIQHYLSEADGPLYGEELSSHAAIIKLNQEAGWQLRYEENGVRYLYHPNEQRDYPDYKGMLDYWGIG